MPIEDVDFLLDNSITDNHVIYIDSAKRDKRAYPNPNRYTIRFTNPYRLVHGIEVLDASVPSTMFNVDVNNNILSYLSSTTPNFVSTVTELTKLSGFSQILSSSLDTGDTASHCVPYTSASQDPLARYATTTPFKVALVQGTSQSSEDIFMIPGALRPFVDECLDVDIDELNAVDDAFDGFISGGKTITPGETTHIVITKHKLPNVRLYTTRKAAEYGNLEIYQVVVDGEILYTTDADFFDFYASHMKKYGANLTFYDHIKKMVPPKIARAYRLQRQSCDTNSVYEWYYYTIRHVSESEFNGLSASTFAMERVEFRPGSYSAAQFLKLSDRYMTGAVGFDTGDVDNIVTYPTYTLIGQNPFIVNMLGSSIGPIIGMSEPANPNQRDKYEYIPNNPLLFGSVGNALVCPGMVNFAIDRYVVLRCDELEDHLYGSYSYGDFTPGIALFRFFEVDGTSHQRNDYVNFTKPPFHPVGKLDKMTLSFFLPDLTTLYDFKGLDHFLVLSIKFYSPKQMRKLQVSVLNPNYRADFQEYMQQYIDYKHDDSESNGRVNDVDETNRVRQAELDYDYSSTESDDGDGGEVPQSGWEDESPDQYIPSRTTPFVRFDT